MSDILSVFGILLAVFTYIESLYHNDVHSCFGLEVQDNKRGNKLNYEQVENVIRFKQYPLLLISAMICGIMFPVSIEIVASSIEYIIKGTALYDISSVTIVLINLAFLIITTLQIINLIKLYNKKKKLNYK